MTPSSRASSRTPVRASRFTSRFASGFSSCAAHPLSPATRGFVVPLVCSLSLLSAASPAAALDTQPPTLTAFGVSGSVDASRSGQSVTVSLRAEDNLSGVYYYIITLASPNGTKIVQEGLNSTASRSFSSQVVVGYPRYMNIEFGEHFGRWSEPGRWQVDSVELRDLAGNTRVYETAALAALGNTGFDLTNTRSDGTPPQLHSGRVETPQLSLSNAPRGTAAGTAPLGLASLTVSDAGSPTGSGVDVVSLYFCKLPYENEQCADAFGLVGVTGTPVRNATQVRAGEILASHRFPGQKPTPGVYHLFSVTLSDVAGNASAYVDVQFNGNQPLIQFFPGGTTLTVTP